MAIKNIKYELHEYRNGKIAIFFTNTNLDLTDDKHVDFMRELSHNTALEIFKFRIEQTVKAEEDE